MLPAAPYLLPVSVSVLYLLYKYLRSGGRTELLEVLSDSLNSGSSIGDPPHRNNDSLLGLPLPLPDTHPEPSDSVSAILDEIRKLNPAVLDEILKFDPAVLDEIRKFDPAVLSEIRKVDATVLDQLRKLCLEENKEGGEEADRSCNGRETETEVKRENVNEKQIEESGGGGENNNESAGEVEKKVVDKGSSRKCKYPAGDCWNYLETGTCNLGSNCKYNHPHRRKQNKVSKDKKKESDVSAVKPGTDHEKSTSGGSKNGKARGRKNNGGGPSVAPTQKLNFLGLPIRPVSKDKKKESDVSIVKPGTDHEKSTSGGSKNGKAHRRKNNGGGPSVSPTQKLNFLGLPIRPGKKECPNHMRNASCIQGTRCPFTHPDPTAVGEPELPSGGNDRPPSSGGASSQMAAPWSSPSSLNDTLPSQGISSQNTEWNGFQAPAYLPERNMPTRTPFAFNSLTETNIYNQYPQQQQVEEFPERPGQPVCCKFLRTGGCKYKSNCKYQPPKTQTAVPSSCTLSDKGLPLRPGQNICTQYSHYGLCNSGAACPFDHP